MIKRTTSYVTDALEMLGEFHAVKEVKLLVSQNSLTGEGTRQSPIRLLTQLWTHDGRLIAQYDPHPTELKEST